MWLAPAAAGHSLFNDGPPLALVNPRTLARLEARILERAAHCIEFELNDPRIGMVTLTRVELANDLSHAKVFYSVLGGDSRRRMTQAALESAGGFIQRQVGRVLDTRRIPHLAFHFDDRIEHAAEMDLMIREALQRDKQINPEAHRNDPAVAPIPGAVNPAPVDPTPVNPPPVNPTPVDAEAESESELDAEYEEFLEAQDEDELEHE